VVRSVVPSWTIYVNWLVPKRHVFLKSD